MSTIRAEALELFLTTLDYLADDFVVVYVDTSYTYSAAHDRLNDVSGGSRLFTFTLSGKDATDGVATADDPGWQTPAAGKTFQGMWFVHNTGVESTSELLIWFDRQGDGGPIEGDIVLNPTSGDPVYLRLPSAPYGLLKL